MKWYKHISDSLDDPFIFELITRHGADGYLVFFGILEIYAREFKTEDSWKLSITLSYLKQKFHKTHRQLITNPLQTISNYGKWEVTITEDKVCIYIPKFKELMDESTLKKLRASEKPSGIVPESFQENSVQTKTKTKTERKEYTADFLSFWDAYPKGGNKTSAFREWNKLNGQRPPIEEIIQAIKNQIEWRKNANGEFRPEWKDPERWIKKQCWADEIKESTPRSEGKEHWE